MIDKLKSRVTEQFLLFDREVEQLVDNFAEQGGRIHCGKGCRNCCSLTVYSTFAEALPVIEVLTSSQKDALRRHISTLLKLADEIQDLRSFLRLHRTELGFCPLLADDGSCGIYPVRPISCRSLLSTRNSDWCGTDLSGLHPLEAQSFMASLDPSVVAFPTHYLAAPQDCGQRHEQSAAQLMVEQCGFSLSGYFPLLVYLEMEYQLGSIAARGGSETLSFLADKGLDHPWLLICDRSEDEVFSG